MIVIGFDPGETTGVCIFEQEGNDARPIKYDNIKFLELLPWLEDAPKPDVVVIEDFQMLPHKAQALIGSRFETIQAIGMIKSYRHKHRAEQIMQSPIIKKIAEKWTQTPPPKNHKEGHWVDAYNHAMYYMINNGLALSALEKQATGK